MSVEAFGGGGEACEAGGIAEGKGGLGACGTIGLGGGGELGEVRGFAGCSTFGSSFKSSSMSLGGCKAAGFWSCGFLVSSAIGYIILFLERDDKWLTVNNSLAHNQLTITLLSWSGSLGLGRLFF